MSALGIAVVPLTKAVASFVMATSVGVAGIGDAIPAKKIDPLPVNERPAIEVIRAENPKPIKVDHSAISINEKLNHDHHVDMVIPGCPHCMANLLAPHPDWLPNLVRSGENESGRILSVKDNKGDIIDLKFKDRPLRLPPVTPLRPLPLPKEKPTGSISKVPSISQAIKVDSVSVKEKLGRVEHLNRSFLRSNY
ncbi:MAG: hypothetical protein CL470_05555 [Acidimicrobiaceae bacterium]|nr:hypothetical protein [Acidimicrobiaceae bacterium]MBJ69332.1 hypothetical protein [Acidimicrobiaceae bacterium]